VSAVAATVLDGRPVAVTGSDDGRVQVWDLATGQPVGHSLTAHTHMVFAVATTVLDGRPVAVTGSGDKTVRIWDLRTCRQIAAFPQIRRVRAVVTTEVGGQAAILAAAGRWLRLMDPVTGKRIGPLMAGHTREITALTTLMRHGGTIAVTGSDDHTVRAWDLAGGRQIGSALPFPNPVTALAAAPDGGLLVCHGTEVTFLAAADAFGGERPDPRPAV
jgi:WD40 repeat protein